MGAHFEEAQLIPLAETRHFERNGFRGAVFVPKEAAMGFTALQIEVDGEHPLKEILKGSTRSYYVIDGEGTFTLNDNEPRTVSPGDLIVIPPDNQYKYQGVMRLFEFNVSKTNGFRDRLVASEPSVVVEPSEQQIACQLRQEQRAAMAKALAEVLCRGYTLTNKDMMAIVPHYGYSVKKGNAVGGIVGSRGVRKLISSIGTRIDIIKYRNRQIYLDAGLPPEETDINKTKASIDADIFTIVEKRRQAKS